MTQRQKKAEKVEAKCYCTPKEKAELEKAATEETRSVSSFLLVAGLERARRGRDRY